MGSVGGMVLSGGWARGLAGGQGENDEGCREGQIGRVAWAWRTARSLELSLSGTMPAPAMMLVMFHSLVVFLSPARLYSLWQ